MSFITYLKSQPLYHMLANQASILEGNLLEYNDPLTAESQVNLIRYAIDRAKPVKVLETGTNKGYFAYLLSYILNGVDLYTFDMDPQSQACVALLNHHQSAVRVHFTYGNTRATLPMFHQSGIGFAWIDGGHDEDTAYNDLFHAIRLGIPYIAMDDIKVFPQLARPIGTILTQFPHYRQVFNPYYETDARGAILLSTQW